ncbi:MAG TPA: DUF4623 domain-containing protein, partial [Niabella sp.]|nr:DUF4623 domain-containing protein [Niabella sp.]
MISYYFKYRLMLATVLLATLFSCTKDFPSNVESSDEVVLQSIKILNAGSNGNTVVEGAIDENTKNISFPRLDPETNFEALRFEAAMSNGAKLDQDSYQFIFGEGVSSQTGIIKVVNNKRFREYRVILRLNVPVYGADFTKPLIYDYTNNELGNPIYPTYTGATTRGSGFDGEHVLIVTRAAGGSHLLKISDLRNNVITPISLNLTGVSGGTFPVNVGAQVNGHSYIANLSGNSAASPIKIYHWQDPTAVPELITTINVPDGGVRIGDNMSANLDANGNGYFYFGDNAATKVIRLKVTNYTTISDPFVFASLTGSSYTMSFNRVGNTSDYIYTGYDAPIRVANESGTVSYALS